MSFSGPSRLRVFTWGVMLVAVAFAHRAVDRHALGVFFSPPPHRLDLKRSPEAGVYHHKGGRRAYERVDKKWSGCIYTLYNRPSAFEFLASLLHLLIVGAFFVD